MRISRSAILGMLAYGSTLQGCANFQSSPVVLDPKGPVSEHLSSKVGKPGDSAGQIGLFELSYQVSAHEQLDISSAVPGKAAPSTSSDMVSVHARQMALDGVNLVDAYCADFFRVRGDDETVLNVARDATAAGGSLASGVLALSSSANAAAAGAISLVTATASNSLDIYTKNFLFGSNNINSVRAMTEAALAAHRKAAFPANDKSIWDFGGAITVIMDHQNLCTPASIRSLVLDSISSSKFAPPPSIAPVAEVSGAVENAVSSAAPGVANAANVAASAVSAGVTPATAAAAAEANVPGATRQSVASKATQAAQLAIAPVIQSATPGTAATVQHNITDAAAAAIGASAASTALSNDITPDRHVQIQVVK